MFGSVERKEMACSSLEIRNCDFNQLFVSDREQGERWPPNLDSHLDYGCLSELYGRLLKASKACSLSI